MVGIILECIFTIFIALMIETAFLVVVEILLNDNGDTHQWVYIAVWVITTILIILAFIFG